MRYKLPFFLLVAGILVLPSLSMSQPSGRGGLGGIAKDPDAMFDSMSGGKDSFVVAELNPIHQMILTKSLEKIGKPVAQRYTRAEFKAIVTEISSGIKSGKIAPFRPKGGEGGDPLDTIFKDPDAAFDKISGGKDVVVVADLNQVQKFLLKSMLDKLGKETAERYTRAEFKALLGKFKEGVDKGTITVSKDVGGSRDSRIEAIFGQLDKNSDGRLSADEVPENYQQNRLAFDANKDGSLDLSEFKALVEAYRPKTEEHSEPMPQPLEEQRPTIFRAGKLPKGLPDWFARLDKEGNCDGQVGLWEARRDKEVMASFAKMDLNGDGLITAEEMLRYQATLKKKEDQQVAAANGVVSNPSSDVSPTSDGNRAMNFRYGGNFQAGGAPKAGGPEGSGTPKMGYPKGGNWGNYGGNPSQNTSPPAIGSQGAQTPPSGYAPPTGGAPTRKFGNRGNRDRGNGAGGYPRPKN